MNERQKLKAFEVFVSEHQAALRGFVRMLGVDLDAVDDLAQETLLVAYRELERFDGDQDCGKWLRGIARNLVRNELRRSARRERILQEEVTEHMLAVLDPDRAPPRFEDADFRALRDCLEELPEKGRRLIAGRYADEWNASILADQLGMSATAIRLALMRTRRSLKVCIERRLSHA
jgi:RNA polymerase sigma-70 factor (ECF subfamily)